jgi:hypothetical protein
MGASNSLILRASKLSDERHEVAVKRSKGEVTSDGLPHCEMAACITAGKQPNLIPVHGKLIGHPEATHGLRIPVQTGHRFHPKLDSDSGANWTLIPAETGQSFVVTQYAG